MAEWVALKKGGGALKLFHQGEVCTLAVSGTADICIAADEHTCMKLWHHR